MDLELQAELAVTGLRSAPPVRRRAGAGPSDDGHWRVAGRGVATLPMAPSSPFEVDEHGSLLRSGTVVHDATVEPVERPRFYDLRTADGIPYGKLARLHGSDVLATTVVQTCIRYDAEDTRCRFCTIEESLKAGATTQVKLPEQLAEVAEAAVRLDGVRQVVMTTGTSNTRSSRRSTSSGSRGSGTPARRRSGSTSRASTRRYASAGRLARRPSRSTDTSRPGPRR